MRGRLNECVLLVHAFDPLQSFQLPWQWQGLVHSCVPECLVAPEATLTERRDFQFEYKPVWHTETLWFLQFFTGHLQVVIYDLGSHSYIAPLTGVIPKVKLSGLKTKLKLASLSLALLLEVHRALDKTAINTWTSCFIFCCFSASAAKCRHSYLTDLLIWCVSPPG